MTAPKKTPTRTRAPAKKATPTAADLAPPPFGDVAMVTVVLDRATGTVEIDDTFSTPAETYYALEKAYNRALRDCYPSDD